MSPGDRTMPTMKSISITVDPLWRLALYGLSLWLIFVTVADFYIGSHRVRFPKYDPDSIGAIIYEASLVPSLMALPLALLAVLPQSRFLGQVFRRHLVWRWVGGILITCLYCLCIFVGLEGVLEILHPGKLAIGVSAVPLFTLLLWTGWLDARWWFSLRPGVAPGNSAKPSGNARSANRNPHDW